MLSKVQYLGIDDAAFETGITILEFVQTLFTVEISCTITVSFNYDRRQEINQAAKTNVFISSFFSIYQTNLECCDHIVLHKIKIMTFI